MQTVQGVRIGKRIRYIQLGQVIDHNSCPQAIEQQTIDHITIATAVAGVLFKTGHSILIAIKSVMFDPGVGIKILDAYPLPAVGIILRLIRAVEAWPTDTPLSFILKMILFSTRIFCAPSPRSIASLLKP